MLDCWKQVGCADAITKAVASPSAKAPLPVCSSSWGTVPASPFSRCQSLPVPLPVCLGREAWVQVGRLMPWQCAGWVEQLSGESKRKSCEVEKTDFTEQGHWSATWVGLGKGAGRREEGGSFGRVSDTAPMQVPASSPAFARKILGLLSTHPLSFQNL